MFRLTTDETARLNRSQTVTSKSEARGGRRYLPLAFTEQGVAMLSSVLRNERAVQVNIEIMRAFVPLRQILAINADLARRLDELERRVGGHDEEFVHVLRAIRQLMQPPATPPKRRRIGFYMPENEPPPDEGKPVPAERQAESTPGRRRKQKTAERSGGQA